MDTDRYLSKTIILHTHAGCHINMHLHWRYTITKWLHWVANESKEIDLDPQAQYINL